MFDEEEMLYQEAVDGLDVKYIDGEAYMSIHTVDLINASFLDVIDRANAAAEAGQPMVPEGAIQGMLWVMTIWRNLHDELELRAEATTIPDVLPDDLLDKE